MIGWDPAASVDVVYVAEPAFSALEPNCTEPSRKATVPVGVPAADVTLTVKVTGVDTSDGLADDVTGLRIATGLVIVNVPWDKRLC